MTREEILERIEEAEADREMYLELDRVKPFSDRELLQRLLSDLHDEIADARWTLKRLDRTGTETSLSQGGG